MITSQIIQKYNHIRKKIRISLFFMKLNGFLIIIIFTSYFLDNNLQSLLPNTFHFLFSCRLTIICFLIPIISLSWLYYKEMYQAYLLPFFHKNIINKLLQKHFLDLSLKSFFLDELFLEEKRQIVNIPATLVKTKNFFSFVENGIVVNVCNAIFYETHRNITWRKNKGTYIKIPFSFDHVLSLKHKSVFDFKTKTFYMNEEFLTLEKITTESITFNTYFNIYTNNQIKTMLFLKASVIQKILSLQKVFPNINFFFTASSLYLFLKKEKNIFKPSISKNLTIETISFYEKYLLNIKYLLQEILTKPLA